ncbi:MAG: MBL fold metallo-hydrolase [Planctomycetota bacterium]
MLPPSPIPASVVVLTRFGGAEVFLVQRSPALRFLPGFWAFPGGSVDPVDRRGAVKEPLALARSAARELFEETGVAVPGLAPGGAREALRRELLAAEPRSERWASLPEDVAWFDAWQPFAEVVTPRFSLRRFRANFFHLELPAGEEPAIVAGELVDGRWVDPAGELARWSRGDLLLAPPALYLLRRMVGRSLGEALELATRSTRAIAEGREVQQAEHAPGVIAIPLATETLPPATTTNAYLLGIERFYVVDPATREPSEQALLFAELEARLARGHRLEGVLVTHHHPDHTGAVEATAQRFGCAVLAHAETFRRTTFEGVERRALVGGERLELGLAPGGAPWTLEVLHTPGHAPGHLAFVESHARSAIVGDLVSTLSTIVIDPEDGDLAQYLESITRVRDHGIGTLFPAHGMPAPAGTALLTRYLDHRRAREAQLVAALSDEPRTAAELVPLVYSDTDRRMWPLAERSLLSGLRKLASEQRAHAAATPDGRTAWRRSHP